MSKQQRVAFVAIAAAIVVAAAVVLGRDDGSQPVTAAGTQTTSGTAQSASKGSDHGRHAGGHAPGGPPTLAAQTSGEGDAGPVIQTRGTAPLGGITVVQAKTGETVRFVVASDTADEVHVHGYDLTAEAGPRKRARFAFPARIEGVFEVELESAGVEIARVIVEPR